MLLEPSIMIFEDAQVSGLELAAILGDAGYDDIQLASHFEPALAALDSCFPIDLLLADIVVPNGLNGIELARMARLRHPSIKVIFVTGYAIGPIERQIGWPILPKPVSDEQLLAEVDRALETALSNDTSWQ